MSLLSIIKECGGISNVVRVLIPDSRLIIEIRDFDLLSSQAKQQAYNLVLKQLTYSKNVIANKDEFEDDLTIRNGDK